MKDHCGPSCFTLNINNSVKSHGTDVRDYEI